MNALSRAIDSVGSQAELAKRSGVSQACISKLVRGISKVSPETAIKIEAAEGHDVTRRELRPDIFGDAA